MIAQPPLSILSATRLPLYPMDARKQPSLTGPECNERQDERPSKVRLILPTLPGLKLSVSEQVQGVIHRRSHGQMNLAVLGPQVRVMHARRVEEVPFRGYMDVALSKQQLDTIIRRAPTSWRVALSSVNGVYVITDTKTGKLYVGSASGDDGLWGRWESYSNTGHGGNVELRELLRRRGAGHADHFRFGVLETADARTAVEDILARESHWKHLLATREHGYNAN